jgi:hypothetical protein
VKVRRSQKTIRLWGRVLERLGKTGPVADQWWFEKAEPIGEPTVRVNHYHPGLSRDTVRFWTVEILGKNGVFAKCTGPTFEGCVDHLEETGVPRKWFKPGKRRKDV